MKTPESVGHDVLDPGAVHDRDTFERFLEALIRDRARAESMKSVGPQAYRYQGAGGWQNTTIAQYLECALAGAKVQSDWASEQGITWRDLAIFLHMGKVYE